MCVPIDYPNVSLTPEYARHTTNEGNLILFAQASKYIVHQTITKRGNFVAAARGADEKQGLERSWLLDVVVGCEESVVHCTDFVSQSVVE